MILRCHQESEGHFEDVIDLIAAEANREAFAHAREDGQDAIATRRYMDIKIADRLNEPAIQPCVAPETKSVRLPYACRLRQRASQHRTLLA